MLEKKYKEIMEKFLDEKMSADEFQTQYLIKFIEWNDRMDMAQFEILNGVFEAQTVTGTSVFQVKKLPLKFLNNN